VDDIVLIDDTDGGKDINNCVAELGGLGCSHLLIEYFFMGVMVAEPLSFLKKEGRGRSSLPM
jgi:hypothetical protein